MDHGHGIEHERPRPSASTKAAQLQAQITELQEKYDALLAHVEHMHRHLVQDSSITMACTRCRHHLDYGSPVQ